MGSTNPWTKNAEVQGKNKENKSTIEENQRKPLKSHKNTVKSSKQEGNQ